MIILRQKGFASVRKAKKILNQVWKAGSNGNLTPSVLGKIQQKATNAGLRKFPAKPNEEALNKLANSMAKTIEKKTGEALTTAERKALIEGSRKTAKLGHEQAVKNGGNFGKTVNI